MTSSVDIGFSLDSPLDMYLNKFVAPPLMWDVWIRMTDGDNTATP